MGNEKQKDFWLKNDKSAQRNGIESLELVILYFNQKGFTVLFFIPVFVV